MLARELVTLNRAEPLPFQLDEHVSEEVRLKYRYIDMRREEMSGACAAPQVTRAMRRYLDEQGFLEIETPMLYKARRKAHVTISCRRARTRASSSRCRSRRRSSSSC